MWENVKTLNDTEGKEGEVRLAENSDDFRVVSSFTIDKT